MQSKGEERVGIPKPVPFQSCYVGKASMEASDEPRFTICARLLVAKYYSNGEILEG